MSTIVATKKTKKKAAAKAKGNEQEVASGTPTQEEQEEEVAQGTSPNSSPAPAEKIGVRNFSSKRKAMEALATKNGCRKSGAH